jgi:hypothetical protein
VSAVLNAPSAPDPDDRDPATEYVTEQELRERGIDPALVSILCPHDTELRALCGFAGLRQARRRGWGSRCWVVADLSPVREGN